MIYPEHARPGDLLPSLALDSARALYPRLDLEFPGLPADEVHATLKQALEWGQLPRFHEERWETLNAYAKATLPEPARTHLLDWFFRGFTGYHPANPDLSNWTDVLTRFAFVPQQSYDMQLAESERLVLDKFLETYAEELDPDGLSDLLDEQRSLPPSAWDRKLLTRYEMVYFDRETGSDPFLVLKAVNKGQALRRTLQRCPPEKTPNFPLEALNSYAIDFVNAEGTWYPPGTGMCGLTEVE